MTVCTIIACILRRCIIQWSSFFSNTHIVIIITPNRLRIDEVHTLVGAGAVGRGSGGGLDISNLVKPALARGELQCIGATTLDEHRKYIERDTALERRFQPVTVGEPSALDTVSILEGLRDRYERHHHCLYDQEALEACALLSERCVWRWWLLLLTIPGTSVAM